VTNSWPSVGREREARCPIGEWGKAQRYRNGRIGHGTHRLRSWSGYLIPLGATGKAVRPAFAAARGLAPASARAIRPGSRHHQPELVSVGQGKHGPSTGRARRQRAGGYSIRQSRHRRRWHGNGRILVFRRQNEPKGLQLRFLPSCQQLAADGTLHTAWTSFRRYGLGDLITGQAGRTSNVRYFHARNVSDLSAAALKQINATP
jgi:hypothetical protein